MHLIKTLAFFLSITLCCSTSAKQLSFSKIEKDDSYQFNYRWLDHANVERHISFSLTTEALFKRFRSFKAYQSKIAQMAINKSVYLNWQKSTPKDAQLTLEKKQGIYQLKLTARTSDALATSQEKIQTLSQKALTDYLEKELYHQFTTASDEQGIKPHHSKIARLAVEDFKPIKPLILEQVDLKNIRTATNYILGFVQSVPYATLENRITSSGAGFNPPPKVLWENQGDCDSKVTLTASLLRSLMPRVKMLLVFIDGHALIAVETRPKGDDLTIEHQGITYVLGEPTGPATFALGKVAEESEQAILNGMYTIETFFKEES